MACPLCGDCCTCSSATTGKQIAGTSVSVLVEPTREVSGLDADWRDEVASRVNAHRARRRRRYDPDSSLSLTFNSVEDSSSGPFANTSAPKYQQTSSAHDLEPAGSSLAATTEAASINPPLDDSRP